MNQETIDLKNKTNEELIDIYNDIALETLKELEEINNNS